MSNEDFQSPVWAAHHHSISGTIHKLFNEMTIGLERLNAIEFDAPWRQRPQPQRCTR